jgi:predicted DNA-binding transcriptional regulator YafY
MKPVASQPDVVRMLTLIPWLLERPGANLEDTARSFATDVATIRRELEHLDYCGLPGLGGGALFDVTVIGDHVTVRMADELRYPMRPTPVEALRLLLTAVAVERVAGEEIPALGSAIAKLRSGLGVPDGIVDVIDGGPDEKAVVARGAIAEGVCLTFVYRGRQDDVPVLRHVEPWAVELSEGAWYLHGRDVDAGEPRIFRLDRAMDLEPTDVAITSSRPDVLASPVYRPQEDDLEVEMTVKPGAQWLLDAVQVDSSEPLGTDGSVRVRLRTGSPEWLARLVLMAGGGAEVVQPIELRERVWSRALDALARLTSGDAG